MSIAFIIITFVIALKVVLGIKSEIIAFKEFGTGWKMAYAVFLVPLAGLLLIVLPFRVGWLPVVILASFLYVTCYFFARNNIKLFETSGTDKTKKALEIANLAVVLSMIGIINVTIFVIFQLVALYA